MNSMQDALQEALEHPVDIATKRRGSGTRTGERDYFWYAVLGYAFGFGLMYRIYQASMQRRS